MAWFSRFGAQACRFGMDLTKMNQKKRFFFWFIGKGGARRI
jgi:hypothetical protein